MNGWLIFGLVLVLLSIMSVRIALWLRKISQFEAQTTAFKKAADEAERAMLAIVAERNAWRARAKELEDERNTLRLQLEEATRPRPIRTQADGNAAPRKSRQAKPPMNE